MTALGFGPTAVGVDGNRDSPFFLRYMWGGANARWRFDVTQHDADQTPLPAAVGTSPVQTWTWTFIAGTYDSGTNTIRLYVNGVEEASATTAGSFNATGPLSVGRAKWQGQLNHFFPGSIDEVQVWDRVVSATELQTLARPLSPHVHLPGHTTAVVVGRPTRITLTSWGDANVTSFQYGVDDPSLGATATPGSPGGQVSVPYTPGSVDTHTVYAAAVDARGRRSDVTSFDFQAVASPVLSGRVTSASTGAPLAGVTVTLNQPDLRTTTAADGTYSFTNLDLTTSTLTAWSGSRCAMSASRQVTITGGPQSADLALRPLGDGVRYTCTETTTPFQPADETVLALTGDDAIQQLSLPFAVPFYGQSYTGVWVDTNGLVTFVNPSSSQIGPGTLPNSTGPLAAVAPYWGDLVVDGAASVRTLTTGAAPDRQFVIEWRNVYLFEDPAVRLSFEVVLGENGDITLNYQGITAGSLDATGARASVGIADSQGSAGVSYSFLEGVLADNQAITFHSP